MLTILWVIFIFSNSLKGPEVSGQESGRITEIVKPLVDAVVGEDVVDVHFLVRKAGHLIEFCLLGLCLVGLTYHLPSRYRNVGGAYGPLAALLVGVIDEYIQSFTGRGSQVQDVLIDFCGALLGFAIGYGVIAWRKRHRKSKSASLSVADTTT